MEANKIPFNFYDHIAIIFPGTMLIGFIIHYFPEMKFYIKEIKDISSTILVLVFIIVSFICGHVTYILAKNFGDFISKISCDKFNADKFKELSEEEQNKILECIELVYKTDFNLKEKIQKYRRNEIYGCELKTKNYCCALVKDKIAKYYVFVSLADFLRSVSFLIFLFLISISADIYILKEYSFGKVKNIFIITMLLFIVYLVFKRSIKMRKSADGVVYSQFLYEASQLKKYKENKKLSIKNLFSL